MDCKPKVWIPEQSNEKPYTTEEIIDEEDEVSALKLKELASSDKMKNLLRNPHLRKIILDLDSCNQKSDLITRLMKEPIFVEFADECLSVVDGS